MTAHATGKLIDTVMQLDQPINLPNRTRVTLRIEPLDDAGLEFQVRVESFKKLIDEHRICSGG